MYPIESNTIEYASVAKYVEAFWHLFLDWWHDVTSDRETVPRIENSDYVGARTVDCT